MTQGSRPSPSPTPPASAEPRAHPPAGMDPEAACAICDGDCVSACVYAEARAARIDAARSSQLRDNFGAKLDAYGDAERAFAARPIGSADPALADAVVAARAAVEDVYRAEIERLNAALDDTRSSVEALRTVLRGVQCEWCGAAGYACGHFDKYGIRAALSRSRARPRGEDGRGHERDAMKRITIEPTTGADTRSATTVPTKDTLLRESHLHRSHVRRLMAELAAEIIERAERHDHTKIGLIDQFYDAFVRTIQGEIQFEDHAWWKAHLGERHHINDRLHDDADLLDLLEMVVDCACAGMARTGTVFPVEVSSATLQHLFRNTAARVTAAIIVAAPPTDVDKEGPA